MIKRIALLILIITCIICLILEVFLIAWWFWVVTGKDYDCPFADKFFDWATEKLGL